MPYLNVTDLSQKALLIGSREIGIHVSRDKNPLNAWEIEGRAFSAEMIPPGNSAYGFLYFQTGIQKGSTLYLSGLKEAGTGQELLFFEIPLRAEIPAR